MCTVPGTSAGCAGPAVVTASTQTGLRVQEWYNRFVRSREADELK